MGRVDLRRAVNRRSAETQRSSQMQVLRELVDALIRRRRERGLSQAEVADRIGTSQRTLSQLENRAHDPKLSTAVAWAEAVGLRLRWDDDGQTNDMA